MWVRIPLETYIFILNFSLPPRSELVNGAVANEIKHVHSPEVIVVLDPRYDLSYKALYISTCSIALKYPTAGHVVTGDITCIPDRGLRSLFKKGPKYRLPSRIDFTKYRDIVEDALQTYCKRWSIKEDVGVHALNDWKNEFLRIINKRIDNFTKHPHLFKQPSSRSVKSLRKKMEKLHRKYVFAPADKAANNVIII